MTENPNIVHNRFRHDANPAVGTPILVNRYNLETYRSAYVPGTIVEVLRRGSIHTDSIFKVESSGDTFAARVSDCLPIL
jgi:hypothetical protein